ncbi:hypothetical protein ACFVVU_00410 [Kitasatospora sp. NPDC057965]|uniref:hypothetical protein n=1 Tax=Kitasatospora sp. NPDC057965 TaxID=3346291 RepID=UPI0036D8B5F2
MDPVGPLARRFPLVARTRPVCTPLSRRVADPAVRARKAGHERDLAEAALVHNRAALLASDAGLPGLARTWCHRQANAHLRSHPPVTTCLALLCTDHDRDRARLLAHYRNLDLAHPGLDVFTTRLALSAIDAAVGIDTLQVYPVAVELIDRTLARPDGCTARDLLAHPDCTSLLSSHQHDRLTRQITACGLGEGTLPDPPREELETALDTTEKIIDDLAGGWRRQPPGQRPCRRAAPERPGIEKSRARREPPDSKSA